MCRRSKKEGSLNLQGGDREKEQMKGGGQDRDILGTNEPGESDKGDVGWAENDGYVGSQKLANQVGEEEAMRPDKTDTGQIDVALAAVPRRVTQGRVSHEKLNKQSKYNLTPTRKQGF